MEYFELPPPASLQRFVKCFWRLRDDQPGPAQTIYPDGCCELILHLGAPMSRFCLDSGWQPQTRCLFAGQMRSAIRLAANGPVDCVGLRLRPAASHVFAAQSATDTRDQVLDLYAIDPQFAARFEMGGHAFAERADAGALTQLLQSRLALTAMDTLVEAALAELDRADGDVVITALAVRLGTSVRSLQSRFLRSVGLTAKEYARVRRLQATIIELDKGNDSLAMLAADVGFADQAHATRELQRLTGLTPAKLRNALRAEREGDATLRMAAAFVRGH